MDKTAERFWADFEAETGEKLEARAMGMYFEPGSRGEGVWGLVILTDRSLRFRFMPKQVQFLTLFSRPKEPEVIEAKPDFVAPRAEILSVSIPKRDFFARVFGPAYPRFELAWSAGGETKRVFIGADPTAGLLERLAAAFPDAPPDSRA